MGRTPVSALKRNVSSESFAVPDGQPLTDARFMISVTALTVTGSPSNRENYRRNGLMGDTTAAGLFFHTDSSASTYSSTSLPSGSRK